MLQKLEENKTLAIVLILVFSLLTRTTELIGAVLVYLVVQGLPTYSQSKKVMLVLSKINLIVGVLYGLLALAIFVFRIGVLNVYVTPYIMIYSGYALAVSLYHLAIFIVFLVKEKNKDSLNKIFAVALILPLIGTLYVIIDHFLVDALYNFFLSLGGSGAIGSMSGSSTGLFYTIHIILLVYVFTMQKYDTKEAIKTGLE